ncbi:MAG: SMC-Scp complex subunit ScpB [Steroidobacteraceae bacterium]
MNESHIRNVIEAALLAAGRSVQPAELLELFDAEARPPLQDIRAALEALGADYSGRGIEIKETAAGFRIQVRRELAKEIARLWPERPARYSRALLETLALIAYRQPITRGEIEAVRGVAVNPNILKTVIERNWVRVVGHRDVPGHPELLGTTREFLEYFGLRNLDELPPLAELKGLGEIELQFDLPQEHGTAPGTVAADTRAGAGAAESGATGSAVPRQEPAAQHDEGARSGSGEKALQEAEEFAASIEADLAAGDDDAADDEELSAADPGSSELVAGPRELDA